MQIVTTRIGRCASPALAGRQTGRQSRERRGEDKLKRIPRGDGVNHPGHMNLHSLNASGPSIGRMVRPASLLEASPLRRSERNEGRTLGSSAYCCEQKHQHHLCDTYLWLVLSRCSKVLNAVPLGALQEVDVVFFVGPFQSKSF